MTPYPVPKFVCGRPGDGSGRCMMGTGGWKIVCHFVCLSVWSCGAHSMIEGQSCVRWFGNNSTPAQLLVLSCPVPSPSTAHCVPTGWIWFVFFTAQSPKTWHSHLSVESP